MIQLILISVVMILLAVTGIGIKMLLDKKAEFKASSCQAASDTLNKEGITCGCGEEGCPS